jgi:hypothetical protein
LTLMSALIKYFIAFPCLFPELFLRAKLNPPIGFLTVYALIPKRGRSATV